MSKPFTVIGAFYPSFYVHDFEQAIEFYAAVFGPPDEDQESFKGWKLGHTWLTIFPAQEGTDPAGNPRNAEFALQVASPAEVDVLYQALVAAGAKPVWNPEDTWMYEDMRFSCVDDPFGIRLDIICPLNG